MLAWLVQELASLKQLLISICLSRLNETRIDEDSDNSTSSEDLLVRNVFTGLLLPRSIEALCHLNALFHSEFRNDDMPRGVVKKKVKGVNTFRTKRSSETVDFSESVLSL